MISLIVPVRISGSVYEAFPRLERIMQTVPSSHFEVVIVDYGSNPSDAAKLAILCRKFTHVQLIKVDNEFDPFSAGHARNIGAQHAKHDVIMFNDIDCICSASMYIKIAQEAEARNLQSNGYDFFSLPVAFLTFEGVEEYNHLQANIHGTSADLKFYDKITRENKHLIHLMAYTGSTVVVNRLHFLSLGGANQEFHGHGGEDYDIKHRLAGYNPIGTKPLDYYLNTKNNQIKDYVGFRAYFALYGIETLYRGLYMVHLWHPKREIKGRRLEREFLQSNGTEFCASQITNAALRCDGLSA